MSECPSTPARPPRERTSRVAPGSRQSQLPGEPVPIGGRDHALIPQWRQSAKNIGPRAIDPPLAQLRDHAREPVLVFIRGQFALLALAAEFRELFRYAGGRHRLECAAL